MSYSMNNISRIGLRTHIFVFFFVPPQFFLSLSLSDSLPFSPSLSPFLGLSGANLQLHQNSFPHIGEKIEPPRERRVCYWIPSSYDPRVLTLQYKGYTFWIEKRGPSSESNPGVSVVGLWLEYTSRDCSTLKVQNLTNREGDDSECQTIL